MNEVFILIIMNHAERAEEVKRFLETIGYERITIAAPGAEPVLTAREMKPGLVLMEACPDAAGRGLDAAVRIQRDLGVPVVFCGLEGDGGPSNPRQRAGFLGYFVEPVDAEALGAVMDDALRTRAENGRCQDPRRDVETNETEYQRLLESLQEGIWQIDAETRTTYVNARMAEILGYSVQEMAGRPLFDFMDEQGRIEARRLFERHRKGMREQHEFRFLNQSGHSVWCLLEASPTYKRNGEFAGAVASVMDITERKQAEADRRAAEEMFRTVIEASPNCVFVKDESGRYLLANPAIASQYDTTPEEMVGRTDREFAAMMRLGPEEAEAFVEDDRAVIRSGRPRFISEERITLPDGSVRWFQTTKVPIAFSEKTDCLLGIAVDITQRKEAEKALRDAFLERTTLLEMMPVHAVLQGLDLRILWANRAACDSAELPREELIGRFCYETWAGRSDTCPGCPVKRAIETGTLETLEKSTPDGRYFRILGCAIRDEEGKVTHALKMTEDITEQKRSEERLEAMVRDRTQALEEAQASLIRQEKLAVLGQLAGGVGHELRNPLGAIKNASYFLGMVLGDAGDEVRETLDILNREVGTAERIIRSLFDAASPGTPARTGEVDLSGTIREELSRIRVPESVTVTTDLEEALPRLDGDSERLAQIIRNLIRNALQAMPDGGRLCIAAGRTGDEVHIRVTDTGKGIPEEVRSKVFEPLFTTKAKGIGLGLALCRSHAQAHGGNIEVESEEGEGTTFTVRLPVTRAGE